VLLVRQDGFLSNALLPGFWTHALIYLGPEEAWTGLPLPDGTPLGEDPVLAAALPAFRTEAPDGPARVIFSSLEHALGKDYVVALRPDLPPTAVAEGIRRALAYHGRPYDFDFDFRSDARLVCTEVVYRAYDPGLNFRVQLDAAVEVSPRVPGLVEVMGRPTTPANELARYAVYMEAHPEPDGRLDYPGRRLAVVRVLARDEEEGGVDVLEGEAAVEALRELVER